MKSKSKILNKMKKQRQFKKLKKKLKKNLKIKFKKDNTKKR